MLSLFASSIVSGPALTSSASVNGSLPLPDKANAVFDRDRNSRSALATAKPAENASCESSVMAWERRLGLG